MDTGDWIAVSVVGVVGLGAGVVGWALAQQSAPAPSTPPSSTPSSSTVASVSTPTTVTLVASEPKARTGQSVTLTARATYTSTPPNAVLHIVDQSTGAIVGSGTSMEALATVSYNISQTVSYQATIAINGIPYTSNAISVAWSAVGTGTNLGRPTALGQTVEIAGPTTMTTGQMMTIAAQPQNFQQPVFQLWHLPPGGNWQNSGHYSATRQWTLQANAPGQWNFVIYARESTAPANETSTQSDQYEAKSGPLLIAVSGGSYVQLVGPTVVAPETQVSLAAIRTAIPHAQYQFWYQPPGGAWQQTAWLTTNTATFPAGPPGQGEAIVYCRSGTNAYEYFSLPVFITVGNTEAIPASNTTVTLSVPSSVNLGQPVTFSASSSGIVQPVYQFWYSISGGAWNSNGTYLSNNTFTLDASTPGTWQVVVDCRSALAPTNETAPQRAVFERTSATQTLIVQGG